VITLTRNQEENVLPVLLIGILFIAATLFFNWRENKQEAVIIELKATSEAHEQRIKKLETETVVIEVETELQPQPPPKPRRVKVKPKPKRISQDFANGDYSKDN
jgi:hypothetical protein